MVSCPFISLNAFLGTLIDAQQTQYSVINGEQKSVFYKKGIGNGRIRMTMNKRTPGFCLTGVCLDKKTTLYINVCGDDAVGMPLTKNMEPIPSPSFIDHHGVDNLIVPIAIDEPVPYENTSSNTSYVVDAVIHTCITERVRPTHRLYEHMLTRITSLALQWVTQETGFKVLPASVHVYPKKAYVEGVRKPADPSLEKLLEATKNLVDAARGEMKNEAAKAAEDAGPVNPLFVINNETREEKGATRTKGPLIQEITTSTSGEAVSKSTGLKKGFLTQTNGSLYGEEGSSEGSTPPPPDPLAFMPESLRGKCKVVDMRNEKNVTADTLGAAASSSAPSAATSTLTGHAQKIVIQEIGNADARPLWSHTVDSTSTPSCISVTIYPPPFVKSVADLEDLSIESNCININYGQYVIHLMDLSEAKIDSDKASAKFVKKNGCLIVKCPLSL